MVVVVFYTDLLADMVGKEIRVEANDCAFPKPRQAREPSVHTREQVTITNRPSKLSATA